jgi:hypothetical protein
VGLLIGAERHIQGIEQDYTIHNQMWIVWEMDKCGLEVAVWENSHLLS